MRLLNTLTWEMKDFISDDDLPQYAILSHTWGDEEVSFQQWENRAQSDISTMKGYQKIKQFGQLAESWRLEWVWVDTCCIDKRSSSELTEAINSMFRWYQNAAVCYAYLSDVTYCTERSEMTRRFESSRWFTRGWTLQELIAPKRIEFFDSDWRIVGTKVELLVSISGVTGIDQHVLYSRELGTVSVARRMSWAANRKTTRAEDLTYCLLGIFDINLPLIYGEGGPKAFRRLQEAIMVTTHDQSLFAWGRLVEHPSSIINHAQHRGLEPLPWKSPHQREPLLGLFAQSPGEFRDSGQISPVDHRLAHHLNRERPPTIVNGGALLSLVIYETRLSVQYWDDVQVAQPQEVDVAILLCRLGNQGSKLVGLILNPWGDEYYSRTGDLFSVDAFISGMWLERLVYPRHIVPPRPTRLKHGDILLQRWTECLEKDGMKMPVTDSGPAWRTIWGDKVLRLENDAVGDEEVIFFYRQTHSTGFAVSLRRLPITLKEDGLGRLMVQVSQTKSIHGKTATATHWVPLREKEIPLNPGKSYFMSSPPDKWYTYIDHLLHISVKVHRRMIDINYGRYGWVDILEFEMTST